MSASLIGPRLFGGVFDICAVLAIALGLAVAMLISPIIILVSAVTRRAAGSDGRRTTPSRSRPDQPHQMGPIIEGSTRSLTSEKRGWAPIRSASEPHLHSGAKPWLPPVHALEQ